MIHNAQPGTLAVLNGRPVVIRQRIRDDWYQRSRYRVQVAGKREWLEVRPGELELATEDNNA